MAKAEWTKVKLKYDEATTETPTRACWSIESWGKGLSWFWGSGEFRYGVVKINMWKNSTAIWQISIRTSWDKKNCLQNLSNWVHTWKPVNVERLMCVLFLSDALQTYVLEHFSDGPSGKFLILKFQPSPRTDKAKSKAHSNLPTRVVGISSLVSTLLSPAFWYLIR